ncbi:peptidoglycan-binding protein [Ahrensia sp. R2A130]|uniref:peptidoglycan-binding protein n=1 Tax=Ahrensia sp. R2A130 TaxID=744979 RepID=UPI0001E0CA24|nr:peptidoglycan-binding protein [Ahrensia sp. R2A130]EFL87862.1 peptidoglycan-binding domain 1 protein [Ahrensia sp. R2A130]
MRQPNQQQPTRTIQVNRGPFQNAAGHSAVGMGGPADVEAERISNLRRTIEQLEQRLHQSQNPAHGMNMGYGGAPMMMANQGYMAQPADSGLHNQLAAMRQQIDSLNSNFQTKTGGGSNAPIDRLTAQIAERQAALDAGAEAQRAGMSKIDDHLGRISQELSQLHSAVPANEISRMAGAIEEMRRGVKFDSDDFKRLENELSELRTGIRSEMRTVVSDSVAPQIEQLEELARHIDALTTNSANTVTPRVDHLASQIDALRLTVDDLPQTLALSRLDSRLSEMSDRLDTGGLPQDSVLSLESRLDEISRALVAVSNQGSRAPQMDMTGIDRVEARMGDLGRAVEKMAKGMASKKGAQGDLGGLASRIDGLHERLGSFEAFTKSADGSGGVFASHDLTQIESQLKVLNDRLDEQLAQSADSGTSGLERQLNMLAARVDEASATHSTAAQMSNLEAQLGQIVRQMGKQSTPVATVDFSPVEARLGDIENRIEASHTASLEAAQFAAQQAVSMMGNSGGGDAETAQVIAGLSADLQKLQEMSQAELSARDENASGIEHMLLQVVDRLGSIEASMANVSHAAPVAPDYVATAASLSASAAMPDTLASAAPQPMPEPPRSAMEAPALDPYADMAQPAPQAAPRDMNLFDDADDQPLEPGQQPQAGPQSSRPNDYDRMIADASERLNDMAPPQPEPQQLGMPQSSRAPSIGAPAMETGDGRPDAVAAARRALQATTAEMNAVRDEVKSAKVGTSKLPGPLANIDFARLRKPLVMGAAALLLAIAAFTGVSKFMSAGDPMMAEAPVIEQPLVEQPAVEQSVIGDASDSAEPSTQFAAAEGSTTREVGAAPADAERVSATIEPAAPSGDYTAPAADTQTNTQTEQAAIEAPEVTPAPATAAYDVPSDAGSPAMVAAASAGDARALFHVGMRYSDGTGVTRNMANAGTWFERAAEKGYAPAQYSIGSIYEKGIGRKQDIAKAASWYEKAAEQGNARAMHNLAVLYATGKPPELAADMDKAVGWFQKAAGLGIKDSQFNLGILYGQGRGAAQNLGESYKWFALAAKAGDTDAANKRDEVANAMDPSDLSAARKTVNDWAPGKLNDDVNRAELPKEWEGNGSAVRNASSSGNPTVLKAQALLNQRGYNVGQPDGLAGPNTRKAVRDFQRSAGIPVTGEIDRETLRALNI